MSTVINSNGTIPQATNGWTPVDIMSSTNAAPIAVTFTGAHGFNDGDTVQIEGHATNTAANGLWIFHKTGANTGELVGSTGNGVGGATGYALDYAINPLITVPADTDLANAASVNGPTSALFNCTPFLYERTGAWKMLEMGTLLGGTLFTTTSTTVVNSSTWTDLGITPLVGGFYAAPGDFIHMAFTSSLSATASSGVAITFGLNGAAVLGFSQDFLPSSSGVVVPLTLYADLQVGAIGTAIPYTVTVMGLSNSATPNVILSGKWSLSVRHYRSNS